MILLTRDTKKRISTPSDNPFDHGAHLYKIDKNTKTIKEYKVSSLFTGVGASDFNISVDFKIDERNEGYLQLPKNERQQKPILKMNNNNIEIIPFYR